MSNRSRIVLSAIACILIYAMIDASIRDVDAWGEEREGNSEDLATIVDALFEDHVFAFEVLGVLLTAAMIGAMVIARPMAQQPDEEHYTDVSDQEIAASQAVSDLEGRA
ncbi:MAG: NADH-quinone oxidoreductase subunit J [Thermoplasmatota archaeon]